MRSLHWTAMDTASPADFKTVLVAPCFGLMSTHNLNRESSLKRRWTSFEASPEMDRKNRRSVPSPGPGGAETSRSKPPEGTSDRHKNVSPAVGCSTRNRKPPASG